ncbi:MULTISPECIES: YjhX family toxin [unclassified Roseobacter]|uniref:YjhX family toxin n=1 Tax=unclassified Roseobacter TaxID=196798 RepID=UPI003460C929
MHFERITNGNMRDVSCFRRGGHVLADCSLKAFDRLKKRRLIRPESGRPDAPHGAAFVP